MPAYRQLIVDTWQRLAPYVGDGKCAGCECLQGALVELRLALDELPPDPDREVILEAIAAAMQTSERHSCLGCDPCSPSALLAEYYREQTRQAAQPSCCPT